MPRPTSSAWVAHQLTGLFQVSATAPPMSTCRPHRSAAPCDRRAAARSTGSGSRSMAASALTGYVSIRSGSGSVKVTVRVGDATVLGDRRRDALARARRLRPRPGQRTRPPLERLGGIGRSGSETDATPGTFSSCFTLGADRLAVPLGERGAPRHRENTTVAVAAFCDANRVVQQVVGRLGVGGGCGSRPTRPSCRCHRPSRCRPGRWPASGEPADGDATRPATHPAQALQLHSGVLSARGSATRPSHRRNVVGVVSA